MIGDDDLLLDSIEEIHRVLQATLNRLNKVRSVHVLQFERWSEELGSLRRIFEDISLPARLILEHLLESKHQGGLVALEAEHLRQAPSGVKAVQVQEFGIIKLTLGELEIAWRDNDYSYYFYPDKVVLHATDEKSALKLFFSLGFRRQLVELFPDLADSPNVVYIHPQMEEWLKKVI